VHKNDAVSFYNTFNQIVMREVVELALQVNCMHLMCMWLQESKGITANLMLEEVCITEKAES